MRRWRATVAGIGGAMCLVAGVAAWQAPAAPSADAATALWHHRNLGKAFYENPTTQQQAVDELKAALDLNPASSRDRLNYALGLLRAAKTAPAIAELKAVQAQDPTIPHTWFNLGIAYKRDSQYEQAIAQFERMVQLAPDEPISHYNLGYLYKLVEKPAQALAEFERAATLDPNLAGPHFQLYNAYREAGRADDAQREQQTFQDIKRRQAGAAIPEDLDWSVYAELLDPLDLDNAADSTSPAAVTTAARTIPGRFVGETAGVSVLDADGDGSLDVLAWGDDGARLFAKAETPAPSAELDALTHVRAVAAGDANNDGLPDLAVLTADRALLLMNQRGAFVPAASALSSGAFSQALWVDYDHDYDLDLLLVGPHPALWRNNGQAGFSDQTRDFPFAEGQAVAGTVFDLVNDTSGHDVVLTYADRPAVIYRDQLAGKYRAQPVEALPAGSRSIVAQDVDADGWVDLVAATPAGALVLRNQSTRFEPMFPPAGAGTRAVALLDAENRGLPDLLADGALRRNQGRGVFAAPVPAFGAAAVALAVSDLDADGREDIVALSADGALRVLQNTTATGHGFLRVSLTGVRNPRLAVEAQVEVKAGTRYQKRAYTGTPLVFGLRDAASIDTVRITWPNGLIQNELKQVPGKAVTFREAQRLSGSCPMIFTWDGQGYRFITDVLGVAPLGASAGDGTYFPVDHDEYIQVPGDALVPVDGALEVRVTEELREVSYLDQIRLFALDHPRDVSVFTNDKFKSPPFPEFRLFGATRDEQRHPVAARDERGTDVREALLTTDERYAATFARDFNGVAARHTLDLDFGPAGPGRDDAVLVLRGWVDWADGSTFLAASQESREGLQFPSIQVKDARGRWVTVVEDMGIPAGKPKTIAIDLSGKFLSASREVRIVTNLCLYVDEAMLLPRAAAPAHRLTPVDASSADLRYRGFSTPTIHPERLQPERFSYGQLMPLSMWNPTPGMYTRLGDVTPLLSRIDDRLVIMGSGDEVRLRFPVTALPALPTGWTRDYLLLVDGWAKDADANTAFSQSVEPLPFHGMSAYPYPPSEHFPDDATHRQWRETYNTRPALRPIQPLTPRGTH